MSVIQSWDNIKVVLWIQSSFKVGKSRTQSNWRRRRNKKVKKGGADVDKIAMQK